jgi:hypothetical protein
MKYIPVIISLYGLVLISGTGCYSQSSGEHGYHFDNGKVKIVIDTTGRRLTERYYARDGRRWILMLQSGNIERTDPQIRVNRENIDISYSSVNVIYNQNGQVHLCLFGSDEVHLIEKNIHLNKNDPYILYRINYKVEGSAALYFVLSTYSFRPDGQQYLKYKPLDFVYTPALRPEPDEVIGDHVFRAPVFMMQEGKRFAALLPDINFLGGKARVMKTSGDVQIETSDEPFMSYGLMNWERKREHVYYAYTDTLPALVEDTVLSYGYSIYLNAEAPERQGYRDIIRYQWEQIGRNNLTDGISPQKEPFDRYIRKAWHEFLTSIALDTEYKGEPVTLLRQGRLAWSNNMHPEADNDTWFNSWFQSLRTAYGMYLYGNQTDNPRIKRQAWQVLKLALRAPQKNGIAPSVFYMDPSGGHWVADHAWGGIENGEYYSMFHNSWTGYWMLRWLDLTSEKTDAIINYTTAFGDFLIRNQQRSGVIPSWYHPGTLEPSPVLRDENAETAGAALFLAELYARTDQTKYLDASIRAMRYIFKEIVPEHKWFDFETFFSCSRKPVGFFDSYTQQHPQNTLSLFQAIEASHRLYQITDDRVYHEYGTALLDYLLLYQQIWSPDFLSCDLFGGFGVQNTDGEWSDSRQGYFAVTLMNYYELTGNREYFERSVSALRSMFSLFESSDSPRTWENYAHASFDMPGGVTGIHWGTGSSVVSIHLIREKYGDAHINVEELWGVGIDGCTVRDVEASEGNIAIIIEDIVETPREIKVTFGRLEPDGYNVSVNGYEIGRFSENELMRGIYVNL